MQGSTEKPHTRTTDDNKPRLLHQWQPMYARQLLDKRNMCVIRRKQLRVVVPSTLFSSREGHSNTGYIIINLTSFAPLSLKTLPTTKLESCWSAI
jgi:hypothetical protein